MFESHHLLNAKEKNVRYNYQSSAPIKPAIQKWIQADRQFYSLAQGKAGASLFIQSSRGQHAVHYAHRD
eukprot:scaffold270754_cov18-Prasinocladus_malaysianus.AAC.1